MVAWSHIAGATKRFYTVRAGFELRTVVVMPTRPTQRNVFLRLYCTSLVCTVIYTLGHFTYHWDQIAGQLTRWIHSGLMQWRWCLRRILDIRWHDFVRNADIRRFTNQPPLSSIIKSNRLTFFGHLVRMDENAELQTLAKQSSNPLQRIGGDHRGGRAQPGWRTFMKTCLRCIWDTWR